MRETTDAEAALCDRLARIWQQELLLGVVSSDVDFLEVDGSSLTAVRIIARVEEATGRQLEIGTLFDYSTPAALAAWLLRDEPVADLDTPR